VELHKGQGVPYPAHRHAKVAVEAAAVDREAELCAFKPSLNPKSLAIAEELRRNNGGGGGGGGMIDSIAAALEKQKERSHRLQEERAMREYEELKACTFTPMINKDVILPHHIPAPAPPGLARHLELVALAKRKAEEQRRVEEKVFKTHPKGNPSLYTVPQPFALSKSKSGSRHSSPSKQ
jgi:hypothetical protein